MLLTNCDVEPDSPPPALQPVLAAAREGKFAETWLAPSVANKSLARTQGRAGRPDVYVSAESHRRGHRPIPRAARELAGAQGAGGCVRARARPEPARRHRGLAQALHRADANHLGTGDPIFSKDSPDYLDRLLPNSHGVRRIPGAKLFFPEEFPDVIADEARMLWSGA